MARFPPTFPKNFSVKIIRPVSLAAALVLAAALFTPSASVRSQLAPLPNDPGAILQSLQQTNADLIRRQEASLKELEDLTTQAREARIFARRG